jgi:chromosome segregation ATPase
MMLPLSFAVSRPSTGRDGADRPHGGVGRIKAKTEEFDTKLAEAKDKVAQLEGERATVTVKADKKQLDADLKEARAEVKRLDGEKATIQIDTRGAEKALAQIEAVKRAEAARAAAEERYARQRQRTPTTRSATARGARRCLLQKEMGASRTWTSASGAPGTARRGAAHQLRRS